MTGRKRGENRLILFTYKNLEDRLFYFFVEKTILLTYSFA